MAEVIYSLNGKFFKDYDIFISSSDGLFDGLKPKKQNNYDWAEYSGLASDLSEKPRFESRKFTLTGFVKGNDWNEMMVKFWAVFDEFNKAGKQRLTIEPFGIKTLIYDVTNEDVIDVKKSFVEGVMCATFTIKLVEQNPIKKILYTDKEQLQITFNSPKWVEVNIDGDIQNYKGSVVINKAIVNRILSRYNYFGRNMFQDSKLEKGINQLIAPSDPSIYTEISDLDAEHNAHILNHKCFNIFSENAGDNYVYVSQHIAILPNTKYTISFYFSSNGGLLNNSSYIRYDDLTHQPLEFSLSRFSTKKTIEFTTKAGVSSIQLRLGFISNSPAWISISSIKIEKGNVATEWSEAPEDGHFISIAGNIDEITDLTTNAEVLWEKL